MSFGVDTSDGDVDSLVVNNLGSGIVTVSLDEDTDDRGHDAISPLENPWSTGARAARRSVSSPRNPSEPSAMHSALVSWAMSTCDDCRVVVTANTENQLRTKTWPEIAKWARLSLTRSWWNVPAMSIYSAEPGRDKSWRADAIAWSENNTEAFAEATRRRLDPGGVAPDEAVARAEADAFARSIRQRATPPPSRR